MSIETTSYYESLLASTNTATATASSSTSLTSDDFISLLCTELQYQDPTEPMDNSQMVDQMTQYSQLEQLTEMNGKMDTLTDSISSMSASYGLDYIGKDVEAEGYTIRKDGDDISTLYLTLDDDAAEVTLNIYDSNGSIVDSQTYAGIDAGTVSFTWDGTDYDGDEAGDGYYYVLASATDADGDDVGCTTTTTGTVTGVSNTDDGVILTLDDGRTVNLADVTYATQ
ncbi:Basal-body rod modification protein FlgD [Pseudodesulfovibrio hydrargyri]|uniref:Basal-body rod modification protein FlgD n=1 Tax=Pseudodesulfovibrio hydrargyri TaxID=2125990 RepID=A0A1J5MW56_9BACT|nr:flagellar hook assembly protein FlgD [Pseudodesulfovibrio hydrargyri]OIQ50805.1 Basal-body rod modification protein FlgD [Pseudodesulfovibrio hydrargyri]